jgi:Alg9-like mannosyltransferase family
MRKSLAAIIAVSAAAQLWLAYRYYGFLTGDDVEVLSEAFRRARGLAYTPWDIRNLFVPDVVVAPVVWLSRGASTRMTIFLTSLPFIALSSLTIWLVYRLALRWCDERAALVAALLFATHWIPLSFGSTVYPRTLAAACVVAAALILDRWPFAAGLLIGVAFADRFSEIVFLAPVLLIITKHRQECLCHIGGSQECPVHARAGVARTLLSVPLMQALKVMLGAAVAILITVGLYDWMTWGTPFSSAVKFAHLTLVEPDFASRVKYQAPWWYLANIVRWCSPALLPLLWYARRSRAMWFLVIPLIAFSAIKHKELRYLQVMIPFLCIAGGIGFARLGARASCRPDLAAAERGPQRARRSRSQVAIALVAISILWDLYGLRYLARKSQPSVMAAQWIAANPSIHSIAASQLWSYGDKLYLGDKMAMSDIGTPPEKLSEVNADVVALYETDLDVPSRLDALHANGYAPVRTFRDDPARAVVVFMRRQPVATAALR